MNRSKDTKKITPLISSLPITTELKDGEVAVVCVKDILREKTLQVRIKLDPKTVDRYASAYLSGAEMPPIQVAKVNSALVLIDGWHRIAALEKLGSPYAEAVIIETTIQEAAWLAAKANIAHGLPLKKSEIKNAFKAYVKGKQYLDARGKLKSYRTMAQELGGVVHYTTIRNWMRHYFPRLSALFNDKDGYLGTGKRGPTWIKYELMKLNPVSITSDALYQAQAAFKAVDDEADRGRLIEQAEEILTTMKSYPHSMPEPSDY